MTSISRWTWVFFALAVCAMPIAMFATYWVYGSPVVYHDDFNFYPIVQEAAQGHVAFSDLWRQHNEHRMLFPYLVFLLAYKAYAWNNVTLCYINHFFAFLCLLSLIFLANKTMSPRFALALALAASVLCFSPLQYFNWLIGFDLQWTMMGFCVCLVAIIFTCVDNKFHAALIAALPATVGSYSVASGLAIWEAVAIAILLSRVRWDSKAAWTWGVMGVAVTLGYFAGWRSGDHPNVAYGTAGLIASGEYILTYLGAPFAFDSQPFTGLVIGYAGVLVFGYLLVSAYPLLKDNHNLSKRVFPWIFLAIVGLANAVMTGAGRDTLGLGSALSSRYITLGTFFWYGVIGLGCVLLPELAQRVPSKRRIRLIGFTCATVSVFVACLAASVVTGYRDYQGFASDLDLSLVVEVEDRSMPQSVLARIYPDTDLVFGSLDSMRLLHQGPYSEPNLPSAVDHYYAGKQFLHARQFELAEREFVLAEPTLTNSALVHYSLGQACFDDGQKSRAAHEFKTACALCPSLEALPYLPATS